MNIPVPGSSALEVAVLQQRRFVLALVAIPFAGCVAGTPREAPEATANADAGAPPLASDAQPAGPGPITPAPIDADQGVDSDPGEPVTKPAVDTWWPSAFVPGVLPEPSNGRGNHGGSAACGSCHKPGGSASSSAWAMGGIVYADISSTTPVASAEIGIKDGERFFQARSASNGYFWLPAVANPIDWNRAEIRIRTAQGDLKMMSPAGSGDCQTCHTAGNRIFPKP